MADIASVFPALTPEDMLYISNEAADAFATVASIRRCDTLMHGIQAANAGVDSVKRLSGLRLALRTGIDEDAIAIGKAIDEAELTRKYGLPMGDTSDNALAAMGLAPKGNVIPDQS